MALLCRLRITNDPSLRGFVHHQVLGLSSQRIRGYFVRIMLPLRLSNQVDGKTCRRWLVLYASHHHTRSSRPHIAASFGGMCVHTTLFKPLRRIRKGARFLTDAKERGCQTQDDRECLLRSLLRCTRFSFSGASSICLVVTAADSWLG